MRNVKRLTQNLQLGHKKSIEYRDNSRVSCLLRRVASSREKALETASTAQQ